MITAVKKVWKKHKINEEIGSLLTDLEKALDSMRNKGVVSKESSESRSYKEIQKKIDLKKRQLKDL